MRRTNGFCFYVGNNDYYNHCLTRNYKYSYIKIEDEYLVSDGSIIQYRVPVNLFEKNFKTTEQLREEKIKDILNEN